MKLDNRKLKDLKEGLTFVLKWEGKVYTNDPDDPGGETKYGISKRAYPNEDIKNLTPERALELYEKDYWDKCGCNELPYPYNVAVFDTAVNLGVSKTQDILRKADSVDRFLRLRRDHYTAIINKNDRLMKYAKGWFNRVNDLEKYIRVNTPPEPPKSTKT